MKRTIVPLILILLLASPVFGKDEKQDALTPTHILGAGQVYATLSVSAELGTASLSSPALDLDADVTDFTAELEIGVGLGLGFEIEAMIPYAFTSETDADGDSILGPAELVEDEEGVGDLIAIVNYRILEEGRDTPQWFVGGIAVIPTGDDDLPVAETVISGIKTQVGDEGGIGEGVFQFGLQTGISRDFGAIEPYLLVRYLFPVGEREDGDLEVEIADELSAWLGAEIPLAGNVRLDARVGIVRIGEEVEEDTTTSSEETEEDHIQGRAEVSAYIGLGEGWTLVIGVGGVFVQDHDVDEENMIAIEDQFGYGGTIGVHYLFGAGGRRR